MKQRHPITEVTKDELRRDDSIHGIIHNIRLDTTRSDQLSRKLDSSETRIKVLE